MQFKATGIRQKRNYFGLSIGYVTSHSKRHVTSTSHTNRDLFFRLHSITPVASVILLDITYSHTSLRSSLISLASTQNVYLFAYLFKL